MKLAIIPLKNEVQYLVILITKDQKRRRLLNFSPIIEKNKKKLNHWLIRDLSLRDRVLITKAERLFLDLFMQQWLYILIKNYVKKLTKY